MLLVLVSFRQSGTCGLIDLQLPRALCLVETWRTQGVAPHHTRAWTREKLLDRKTPSLLWGVWGYHFWFCIPQSLVQAPLWVLERGGLPPWPTTIIIFVLVLVQPLLAAQLHIVPLPTGWGEPSSREVSHKERLLETLQPPGLNKHFLLVSQPWEEVLVLCPFCSWNGWASDHCVICPGSLSRLWSEQGFQPRIPVSESMTVQVVQLLVYIYFKVFYSFWCICK